MTSLAYKNLKFTSLTPKSDFHSLFKALKGYVIDVKDTRILDLGCGTGNSLFDLSSVLLNATLVGVDISKENIDVACQTCTQKKLKSRVTFHRANYLDMKLPPFDVIFTVGVLHLIPLSTESLFEKISNDLKSKGKLIVVMPFDCFQNRLLIGLRHILRFFRSNVLDELILSLAKKIYPSWSGELLKERLEYMYMIPFRLDSPNLHRVLEQKHGIVPLEILPWPSTSIAKLKHHLVVFQKQ